MHAFFIILIIILSAAPSRAVIPLELITEIQLPDSTVDWDVQHWMDDSTFGWVATRRDSIVFSVDGTTINSTPRFSIANPDGGDLTHFWKIRLTRLQEQLDLPTAFLVVSDAQPSFDEIYLYAGLLDLVSQSLIGDWNSWLSYSGTSGTWNVDADSISLYVFPSPPILSSQIIWSERQSWWSEYYDSYYGVSRLFALDSTVLTVPVQYVRYLSLFSTMPVHAVISQHFMSSEWDGSGGWPTDCTSTISILRFGNATIDTLSTCVNNPSDNCLTEVVLAQTESDGTEQAIVSDGSCYRVADGSLAWQLEDEFETFFIGRVVPHGSQEVFVLNGARFNVLDASTGTLIDSTAALLGVPRYFLKSTNGIAEIVTYQQNTRTVRVYRPDIAPITTTIAYFPATNSIRLRWTPIPGAASYYVCRSPFADSDFCEQYVHIVDGTSLTLPLEAGVPREFFRVRAVFE